MVMACSVVPRDEEHDFVEQPSRDFFCPVTFDALLEPYLTECCGHHLSETAYRQLQAQGKPCPVCKDEPLKAVKDKYHKRRVSSLMVRCPHKAADVAQYRANYIQLLVPVTCNMGNKGNQYETTMTTYLCRKIIIQRVR